MAHEKLNIRMNREWARSQAKTESEGTFTSVGGLSCRMDEMAALVLKNPPLLIEPLVADPRRQSLGKFVELSRRRLRLSVEQLASRANVDLAGLLAIEKAEEVTPEPRTIYQLAAVLQVGVEPLLELAGLVLPKTTRLTESAVRFAARSEPMQVLSEEEEAALNWFVKELTKA